MTDDKLTKDRGGYDRFLLLAVLLLLGIGLVMVYSASSVVAAKRFGSDTYFFERQAAYALAAILLLICCRYVPYTFYMTMAYPLLGAALVLLVVLYVPGIGHEVGGAKRWLRFFGVSFQPSEFARLALIVYLAYSMTKKREKIKEFSIGFLPHAILFVCFTTMIVLQPDFGMAVIIALIVWTMLFLGGVRLCYLLPVLAAMAPIAYYVLIHAGYRLNRLASFLDPWQHQSDAGYQVVHSLMAFGSGGIFGAGIGNGYQKLFYLPEPHTDFIFSVIGEELGLVGVCFVTGLYVIILWRGIVIAMRARDLFATFLAAGLTISLGLQVCINQAVALGLLPTKGLTLPFASYGGTSLVVNAVAVGILMNISARQPVLHEKYFNVARKTAEPLLT
ncbi:MAG: putative lipid II flippase FtsW [Desulfobacterales bacterium]|nr:putative lipid II flippase FtsW [Desulfobacterales bacterium]